MRISKLSKNNCGELVRFIALECEKTMTLNERTFCVNTCDDARAYEHSYIAYEGKEIVGFMFAESIIQGVHIIFLFVAPQHRNKGVASRLLTKIKNYVDFQNLLIYAYNNKELDRFYKKNGFVQSDNLTVSCYCKFNKDIIK